jgi:hypothetical protein
MAALLVATGTEGSVLGLPIGVHEAAIGDERLEAPGSCTRGEHHAYLELGSLVRITFSCQERDQSCHRETPSMRACEHFGPRSLAR